jgi:hypothetical protein
MARTSYFSVFRINSCSPLFRPLLQPISANVTIRWQSGSLSCIDSMILETMLIQRNMTEIHLLRQNTSGPSLCREPILSYQPLSATSGGSVEALQHHPLCQMVLGISGHCRDHRLLTELTKPSRYMSCSVSQAAPSEIIASILPAIPSDIATYIHYFDTTRDVAKLSVSHFEVVLCELTSSVDATLSSVEGVGLFSQILVLLPKRMDPVSTRSHDPFCLLMTMTTEKMWPKKGGKFEKVQSACKPVFLSDSTKTFLERRPFTLSWFTET